MADLTDDDLARIEALAEARSRDLPSHVPALVAEIRRLRAEVTVAEPVTYAVIEPERLGRLLARLVDEGHLTPYGSMQIRKLINDPQEDDRG